jgi:DNA polymerase I-like protein with 3'-5' exonuclease and polymerase domains
VAADYSQIELRIMAHLSGDASLLTAFAEDRDVHQATAAEVFGVPLQNVSADQRRSAKAINFGLIYGMSAFGLAKQLGIGRGEAQKYVDLYFERYPGVRRYMDETRKRRARPASSKPSSAGGSTCRKFSRAIRRCASTRNAAPSTRPCRARPPTSSSAP